MTFNEIKEHTPSELIAMVKILERRGIVQKGQELEQIRKDMKKPIKGTNAKIYARYQKEKRRFAQADEEHGENQ